MNASTWEMEEERWNLWSPKRLDPCVCVYIYIRVFSFIYVFAYMHTCVYIHIYARNIHEHTFV